MAQLAEWLCEHYHKQEPVAVRVVRDMHMFIMPSMNPDGFVNKRRSNA